MSSTRVGEWMSKRVLSVVMSDSVMDGVSCKDSKKKGGVFAPPLIWYPVTTG